MVWYAFLLLPDFTVAAFTPRQVLPLAVTGKGAAGGPPEVALIPIDWA